MVRGTDRRGQGDGATPPRELLWCLVSRPVVDAGLAMVQVASFAMSGRNRLTATTRAAPWRRDFGIAAQGRRTRPDRHWPQTFAAWNVRCSGARAVVCGSRVESPSVCNWVKAAVLCGKPDRPVWARSRRPANDRVGWKTDITPRSRNVNGINRHATTIRLIERRMKREVAHRLSYGREVNEHLPITVHPPID